MILPLGWVVVERVESLDTATGSFFSVGYVVESESTGQRAFLKALDFHRILEEARKSDDPADGLNALEDALAVFRFERDVCEKCLGMDRVVSIVASGAVTVDSANPFSIVPYLIFEQADGDVRKFLEVSKQLDIAWALRCMHNIAKGLNQLHVAGFAHQDIKPSNVLMFGRDLSKVGDLGRCASRFASGPHDEWSCAGSVLYAPPELLYGQIATDWNARRMACDLYLLGSMLVFFFANTSMTSLLFKQVANGFKPSFIGGDWDGDYQSVLPMLQAAFEIALQEFRGTLPTALQEELSALLVQLCEPDPNRRGNSRARARRDRSPFALDYFISRFDNLAKRAESRVGLRPA